MTKREILRQLFFKSVLPIITASLLYLLFRPVCIHNGQLNYVQLWILCGIPFGIHRMMFWFIPFHRPLGETVAILAMNLLIGGVIGGIVLSIKIIRSLLYLLKYCNYVIFFILIKQEYRL